MNDALACLLIFAEAWLVFLGLALLTVDVFRVAWMQLEGIDS